MSAIVYLIDFQFTDDEERAAREAKLSFVGALLYQTHNLLKISSHNFKVGATLF